MVVDNAIKEWWTNALLNEMQSAHPVFGNSIEVRIEGETVILTGTVDRFEQIEEIEDEARSIDFVHDVVNKLTVTSTAHSLYHMQTVIAVFPDDEDAKLACHAIETAKIHESSGPHTLHGDETSSADLAERAKAACVGQEGIQRHLQSLQEGKVLVIDRVPEDDALRVISALEGSRALAIETLAPEPNAFEE